MHNGRIINFALIEITYFYLYPPGLYDLNFRRRPTWPRSGSRSRTHPSQLYRVGRNRRQLFGSISFTSQCTEIQISARTANRVDKSLEYTVIFVNKLQRCHNCKLLKENSPMFRDLYLIYVNYHKIILRDTHASSRFLYYFFYLFKISLERLFLFEKQIVKGNVIVCIILISENISLSWFVPCVLWEFRLAQSSRFTFAPITRGNNVDFCANKASAREKTKAKCKVC